MMDNRPPIDELLNCTAEELAARPKKVLLWENANLDNTFVGQAIELPTLHEYDGIEIVGQMLIAYKYYDTSTSYRTENNINAMMIRFVFSLSTKMYQTYRPIQIKYNENKIEFSAAYDVNAQGENTNNNACLPYRIYGIKGV